MKLVNIISVIAFAVGSVWVGGTRVAQADNLLATDKEIKFSVPMHPDSLPVQFGSSLSTQYASDQTPDPAAGMLRLGSMALEEGIRYPSLPGDIYSGNSIGEKLLPSAKYGLPVMSPNSAYLTSWLTQPWASVNLNLAHIHQIEKTDDQLSVGVAKAVSIMHNALSFSVGEYLVSELDNRYWSRTTNLSMDYWWQRWDFSMSIEQRQDSSLCEQSVWAAIKKKF